MQSRVPPRARRPIHSKQRPQFPWNSSGRGCRKTKRHELLVQLSRILTQRLIPPMDKEETDE